MRNVRVALAVIGMAVVLVFLFTFLAMQEARAGRRKPFLWDGAEHPVTPSQDDPSHRLGDF
jgi:hypothetical protein